MPSPSLKNIILIKKARPKAVTLPNRRTLKARYERAKQATDLPENVHLKPYPLRAAPKDKHHHRQINQQHGQGLGSPLRLVKKVVRNPIEKKLGREVMSKVPDL